MDAEFFCRGNDAPRQSLVEELLRKHVDPAITLVVSDVERGSGYDRSVIAERYRQLLRATIPPSFGLSVTTWDLFEARLYVQIYWRIMAPGYTSYVEGVPVLFESYSVERVLSARGSGLSLFFPALALHGKMALVPCGQATLLQQVAPTLVADFQRDVIEVDFEDPATLEQAFQSVARDLRQEIRREVLAFSMRSPQEPLDLSRAAEALKVTPGLIQRALQDEARDASATYRQLSCTLGQRSMLQGHWTKTTLSIRNDSNESLHDVMITIRGPVEVLPADLRAERVGAGGTIEIPLSINPADAGELPLELRLVAASDMDLATLLPAFYVWIESVSSPEST